MVSAGLGCLIDMSNETQTSFKAKHTQMFSLLIYLIC